MPDTFAGLLDDADGLVAGVLNTHPSTRARLAAAVVRQLSNLQAEIVPFMETSGSFSTAAGVATYALGTVGFPRGLLRFERLWYDLGAAPRFLDIVDPGTIRYFQENASQAYPTRVCWYEERLQFGPAPAGVYLVRWDAILDAKKDTRTGVLLTAASGTESNPWFAIGKVPLRHLAWADYYSTSPDQRPDLASSHGELARAALERLRLAGQQRQQLGATLVTPNAFDDYRGSRSARLSTIFPGAPS